MAAWFMMETPTRVYKRETGKYGKNAHLIMIWSMSTAAKQEFLT
jgi:hypothetical protein